jgi:hypothetical protein
MNLFFLIYKLKNEISKLKHKGETKCKSLANNTRHRDNVVKKYNMTVIGSQNDQDNRPKFQEKMT